MLHTASAASELHRSARPATRVDTICFGSIALKDCFWPVLPRLRQAEVGGIRRDVLENGAGHIYSMYRERFLSHLLDVPALDATSHMRTSYA